MMEPAENWYRCDAADEDFFNSLLVLLHHKSHLRYFANGVVQQGHRGKLLTSAVMRRRRTVAIEFGICRSGRKGGAAGFVTVG
jgi:hypothetical protein